MTLDQIMLKYPTDKSTAHHGYTLVYEKFFHPIWDKELTLFIIGIGGYKHIDKGGGDLYAFAEYFPNAKIYAIDIYPKELKPHPRIQTFVCSQTNEKKLDEILKEIPQPDIIIDDGSHVCQHQIISFNFLFPKLKEGGLYVIEDSHTSYWSEHYDGCEDRSNKDYPHIHNHINKQKDLNVVHSEDKLIIIRK